MALKILSKEQISKAKDLRTEEVPTPEWAPEGDPHPEEWGVLVRNLTSAERDHLEAGNWVQDGKKGGMRMTMESYRSLHRLRDCHVERSQCGGDGSHL